MRGRWGTLLYVSLWCGVLVLIGIVLLLRFAVSPTRVMIPLSAYLPFLIIPYAVVTSLLGLVVRHWCRIMRVSLIAAAVLLPVTVYGPRLMPSLHPPGPGMVRVATWNVFLCRHGVSGVRETIGTLGADIIALQEVVGVEDDSTDSAQLTSLVKPLGYTCEFVGYRPWRPGRQPGMAICVRDPVKLLSLERRTYHPSGQWRYVFVEVEVEGTRLNVVVPHLYPFALGTVGQSERNDLKSNLRRFGRRIGATTLWHLREGNELVRLVGTFRDPTIIMGDFNTAPDHPIHWRLRRHLVDCLSAAGKGLSPTFTFFLPVRIDYIYVTKSIRVHAASVIPTSASDHRPVVAVLSVPGRS
ncbi:endonuclease/exonuclease/phosphatase family protein [Candidatus Fermentibacteria bacterium]|nr:endonuclease/exonuclease/phosphatase family protein [Candidatus Fermentibacteria bacterium]